jgi:hypothetical protein
VLRTLAGTLRTFGGAGSALRNEAASTCRNWPEKDRLHGHEIL